MKLTSVIGWIDRRLNAAAFADDDSNNGLQLARRNDEVRTVAFAVDASVRSVRAAAEAKADLLVVHHGISWGGGIRTLTDGVYEVVKAAADADLAIAAWHLPLDAHPQLGNNYGLARYLGLARLAPAFAYRGHVIGVMGYNAHGKKIGICSGGAGSFASDAKRLGCDLYVTGEADWGEKIAAENVGMPMVCAGHYETETFGVRALMGAVKKSLRLATTFVALALAFNVGAAETEEAAFAGGEEECGYDRFYVEAGGQLVLPQGGSKLRRLGGAAFRFGWYATESVALEGEAAWLEDRCGLAARALVHLRAWEWYDRMFGYSRFDPFVTGGVQGWLGDGQVGPAAGLGFLYYLTDTVALRVDATATLGVESRVEVDYALGAGVRWSF